MVLWIRIVDLNSYIDFYIFCLYGEKFMIIVFYILHVTLLLLHEIESGYEKEWEILKLPGKITGFLLLHIPIIMLLLLLFYCIIEYPGIRSLISIIIGFTGFIPYLVHKVIINRKEHFNKIISNIIIMGNIITGILLIIIGIIERIK